MYFYGARDLVLVSEAYGAHDLVLVSQAKSEPHTVKYLMQKVPYSVWRLYTMQNIFSTNGEECLLES